jgi:hypothetical protein
MQMKAHGNKKIIEVYKLDNGSLTTVPEIRKYLQDNYGVVISNGTVTSRLKKSRDPAQVYRRLRKNPNTKTKREVKYKGFDYFMKLALKNI